MNAEKPHPIPPAPVTRRPGDDALQDPPPQGCAVMAFDQKCYDLAKHFIDDGSTERTYALSKRIQYAIEDWLTENRPDSAEPPESNQQRKDAP